MPTQLTGGEAVIKTLESCHVTHVFGYSGGAALPLFDAIETTKTPIQLVMTRHEQGATHMADGYARVRRSIGAVIVTSGPGATNTITGLMTAQMDNVPIAVIAGQVPTHAIGTDAFQETNTIAISAPVTKKNAQITDPNAIATILRSIVHTATTGRPGSVLVDIPKDVSASTTTAAIAPAKKHRPLPVDRVSIERVAALWKSAKRPLILAGHGVLIAGASDALTQLAVATQTPVTTTLLGKGAFPESHTLSLGMLGMHGTAYANKAVMEADFLLAIGTRFDDRIAGRPSEFCKNAAIVHIDIDPKEFGKVIQPTIAIHADARTALEAMHGLLPSLAPRHQWLEKIAKHKRLYPLSFDPSEGLTMQEVIQTVHTMTKGNAVVSTDVGQHQMWAAQFWKVDTPDTWVTSGGAGTMGFGFPAAIGAQFAAPNKTVIAFVGDGGFQMTLHELATAVRHKLPIKLFVLDNQYLGMVRQWQEAFYDNRESGVDMSDNPDFVAIAKAYGAAGIRIDSPQVLEKGIQTALAINDRPVVVHVRVNRVDNVYPFIPAGAPYTDMQIGPSDTQLSPPTGST